MASSAANAAVHKITPAALPATSRIRPPRLMKGDPHPNNNPQPPGEPPLGRVWVQGRWREQLSNAAKQNRAVQARQVAKALRHRAHGLDIYAYRHVRTNQVIYSLSRTLQNTQVLKQMVFHGKKTVPEATRRDMWTPYFSVHFPENPAGAFAGLFAYKRLLELSMQRQLSPPESLLLATEDDVKIARSKLGDPAQLHEMEESDNWQIKRKLWLSLPREGELLPKKLRAKRLMDQKATSVADVAFVLDWISSGPGPLEKMIAIEEGRAARHKDRTKRGRARINKLTKEANDKEKQIRERSETLWAGDSTYDRTKLSIDTQDLQRLSLEHQGVFDSTKGAVSGATRGQDLSEAEKQWRKLNPVKASDIDTEEYQARKAVGKTAEHNALKDWYAQADEDTTTETSAESMWTYVKQKREAALLEYDEGILERRKSTALARAASEASAEYEVIKGSDPTTSVTLESLVAEKQEAALKHLDKEQAAAREREERRDAAVQKLLSATPTPPVSEDTGDANTPAVQPRALWTNTWDIKMYWSDLNDGLYAKRWPQTVQHGTLEPFAVAQSQSPHLRLSSKTVHVIGGGLGDGWMPRALLDGMTQPAPKPEQRSDEVQQQPARAQVDEYVPIEQPPPKQKGRLAALKDRFVGLFVQ